ncbi:carboxypeptidase regulatory-like domain-containing protein [Aquimarina sp. M1]
MRTLFIHQIWRLFLTSLFLLLLSIKGYGQFTIKGNITNSENATIGFATVQVLNSDKNLIAYGISKSDGYYTVSIKSAGDYILKVTHISFLPKEIKFSIPEDTQEVIKNISLKKNTENLDEIVLKVDHKLLRINNDTITYNLKRLTNGTETTLADVIDKLPGVKLNNSGLITVNGKQIDKLLIDGEELFKNQHRITSESITSEMIKGIRYLDKYKDFGNIKNFNNKKIKALEISIKDKFKNKITGDIKVSGGIKEKGLIHTNLFRLGGKLKAGFIGDWNNLGTASITSNEYYRLTTASNDNKLNKKGFRNDNLNTTPTFLDESLDIAERTNTFGALSLIYKPNEKTKVSLLNVVNNTRQEQLLSLSRRFFDQQNTLQEETRKVTGDFLLGTTILDVGYQPNDQSFFSYNVSYIPTNNTTDFTINSIIENTNNSIDQFRENNGYLLNQNLNYSGVMTSKTLLSITGVHSINNKKNKLLINSSEPVLGLQFSGDNSIDQFSTTNETRIGYELKTTTKFSKKTTLEGYQGIFNSTDTFINETLNFNQFDNDIITDRFDSYLGGRFTKFLTKKTRVKTDIEYRFLSFKRLNRTFEKQYFLPSINLEYNIKPTKRLDFGYSFDIDLPKSASINDLEIISDYFSKITNSIIPIDKVFPEHQFNATYFGFNGSNGSSLLIYTNHIITPEFSAINSFFDNNNITNIQNGLGTNRVQTNFGINMDGRIKKLKLKIFSEASASYSSEENKINFLDNTTKTLYIKERAGIYSRFRKGINFNTGINIEYINFKNSLNAIETTSVSTKPYLYIFGSFYNKKISWNFGGEYAIYKTDEDNTEFFNIKPSIRYKMTNNWELSLTGFNILNINNSNIANNINTSNYTESRISQTLEGYITFGIYYLIK